MKNNYPGGIITPTSIIPLVFYARDNYPEFFPTTLDEDFLLVGISEETFVTAKRTFVVFPQLSSRATDVGRHAADWQSGFGHALDQGMTSLGSSSPLRKFIHLGYEDIHGQTGENMPGRDFFVVISHGE